MLIYSLRPIESRSTVLTTLELMCKWRVHRVPILDSAGELETTISQSFLAKYLAQFIDQYVPPKSLTDHVSHLDPQDFFISTTNRCRICILVILYMCLIYELLRLPVHSKTVGDLKLGYKSNIVSVC